jgi:pimeloyl-ACP methyl ester carboxylesterase
LEYGKHLILYLYWRQLEFDNPSFGYSDEPESFALAFRSMVDACEVHFKKCRQKVAFVWHSWGAPKVVELARFYPGDQYVDWVGISLFQQLYPWARNTEEGEFSGGTMEQVTEVLEFATARDKPIMIAESTPFFGMDLAEQDPSILQQYNLTVHDVDIWDLWFQPTLDLIEQYDIGMWSYINCDWNSQPMWQGIGFGDTRLASSPRVMEQWMDQVLDSERFTNHIHCHPHEHSHEHSHDHPHEHDDHDRDHEHTTPSFESLALTEKDIMIFGRKATYFLPIMYLIAIAIFALSCYKRCITKRYAGYHTLGESESSFSYDGDQSTLANGGVDTMTAVD